jgi:hypothetical protein
MNDVHVHTPIPHPGPGRKDPDLISKSAVWLCDNTKRGIRRDEGGDLLLRQMAEMDAAGFSSMSHQQQAEWILGQKKELIDSVHHRVDSYIDEIKMRAIGR